MSGFDFGEDLNFHVSAQDVSGLLDDHSGIAAGVFVGGFVGVFGAFAGAQPAGVHG